MRVSKYIYLGSLVIWLLLVVIDLVRYLRNAFNALPTDEVYANGVDFQLVAFCLTRFPLWLGVILVVLLVEFFIFRRR